jgi:hypothetical protein
VVHRVAGERAKEDVVADHEQSGETPDAVQAGQPLLIRHRPDPNAARKRSRKALIRQTGAWGAGRKPSSQPHPAIRFCTAGSWEMIDTGTL